MSLKTKCALCGEEVDRYDICETCEWQDDDLQRDDPNFRGGANKMSLNEARKAFKEGKKLQ